MEFLRGWSPPAANRACRRRHHRTSRPSLRLFWGSARRNRTARADIRNRRPSSATRADTLCEAQDAIAWARRQISTHTHPAQRRITDEEWTQNRATRGAADRGAGAVVFLTRHARARQMDRRASRSAGSRDKKRRDRRDRRGSRSPRCALRRAFPLRAPELAFSGETYLAFFSRAASATALRMQKKTHPRLKILGLLEARLIDADLILLGGLDETIWPPEARSDAFLNRPMRATLGLSPPERKIGQTAHDFVMAMGAPRVILSRAHKRDGSPMVASRFIQRLAAVAGDAFADCRARGARYLELARALDRPLRRRRSRVPCHALPFPCARQASASRGSRCCAAILMRSMPSSFSNSSSFPRSQHRSTAAAWGR